MVEAAIGRFGPYIKHGPIYANIADVEDVFTIGMNRAMEVLALKAARGPGRGGAAPAEPLKSFGEHPDGGEIQVMPGRYGPYIKWGKVNATLPKEIAPEAVTLEEALALIAEKAGKSSGKRKVAAKKAPAKPAARTATKAKPAAKAAAKPAAKKAAVKKPAAKSAANSAVHDDVLE